jgi:hypothetical protein
MRTDPYAALTDDPAMMVRYMLYDMLVNKRLRIFSGHADHPSFTPKENVIFRTVHDFYTHAKLLKPFKEGLEVLMREHKGKITPEDLKTLLPRINLSKEGNIGHSFTMRGEFNAYSTHSKIAPPEAKPALFTEIVGQVCYYNVVGSFPTQKASIMTGFDFDNVGKFTDKSHERRYAELLQAINSGSPEVQTSIKALPVAYHSCKHSGHPMR